MLRIGLTGGIGSGKSTVANMFAEFGVPIIDTDLIARELVQPGQAALGEIVAAFGARLTLRDGSLDRAALRELVFADAGKRRRLEEILHPRIRETVARRCEALATPYCIVVIPLLFETGQRDLVDKILLVDLPEDLQARRAMSRDGAVAGHIKEIMATQASRAERLAGADEIIDNRAGLAELREQVASLHAKFTRFARG